MKIKTLSAVCTSAVLGLGLTFGGAHAMPLQPAATAGATAGTITAQVQYRDFRPGWERPGFRRGGPRVVCRVVARRIIDRFGRTRIVREEVCRRRW